MPSCCCFEQQTGLSLKEDFQRLISEGVQTVGLETMQDIKVVSTKGSSSHVPGTMRTVSINLGDGPLITRFSDSRVCRPLCRPQAHQLEEDFEP